MLHQADAVWQTGRSDVLLKLKLHLDAEAVVIGHEPGRGKYQGLLGALLVQTPEGQRFRLGSGLSDAQRQSPPAIGSTVTYRYRDLSANGIPKFATFLRVRDSE
jgi:DNA ligase-1